MKNEVIMEEGENRATAYEISQTSLSSSAFRTQEFIESEQYRLLHRAKIQLVFMIVVYLTVSITIYMMGLYFIHMINMNQKRSESNLLSLKIADAVKESSVAPVELLRGYYDSINSLGRNVTRDMFKIFAHSLLSASRSYIMGVEYVPIVIDSQREYYETSTSLEMGLPNITFQDISPNGLLIESPQAEYYTPALFVEPFVNNEEALLFNLRSNESRNKTMSNSRDTNTTVSTEVIQFVQGSVGFLSVIPLYRNGAVETVESRRNYIYGYLISVIDSLQIFENTFHDIPVTDHINLNVLIASHPSNELFMCRVLKKGHSHELQNCVGNKVHYQLQHSEYHLVYTYDLEFNTQRWTIYFATTKPNVNDYWSLYMFIPVLMFFMISVLFQYWNLKRTRVLCERGYAGVVHLNSAVKKAEAAEMKALGEKEEKNGVIQFLAHELRNPLFQITAAAGFLNEKESLSEDEHEYVEVINQSAELMISIVSDVLDVSRLEEGKLDISYLDMDLPSFISKVTTSFQPLALKNQLSLTCFAQVVPTTIFGDSTRLRQLLTNFLTNACKFTKEEGYITIFVSLIPGNKINRPTRLHNPADRFTHNLYKSSNLDDNMRHTFMMIQIEDGETRRQVMSYDLNEVVDGFYELTEKEQKALVDIVGDDPTEVDIKSTENCIPDMYVRFSVVDSGEGIETHVLPNLFEAFRQASLNTFREHGGSGLGLAISHRLIDQMNGIVTVDTVRNRGSIFSFFIPFIPGNNTEIIQYPVIRASSRSGSSMQRNLSKSPQRRQPSRICEESPDSTTKSRKRSADKKEKKEKRYTVLVADDNALNRKVLTHMLQGKFNIITASDGQEAYEKATITPDIHCFLLDYNMPKLSGVATAQKIREYNISAPIIGMSANPELESIYMRGPNSVVNSFVSKPITKLNLIKQITDLINSECDLDKSPLSRIRKHKQRKNETTSLEEVEMKDINANDNEDRETLHVVIHS